jgi:thioredoxin 1
VLNVIIKRAIRLIKAMPTAFILAMLMNISPTTQGVHDPRATPYLKEFVRVGKLFGVPSIEEKVRQLHVVFGSTPGNYAECHYGTAANTIIIDEVNWKPLPEENRNELVMHEAGHCILDLVHTKTGIMGTGALMKPEYYRANYSRLLNEIFLTKARTSTYIKYKDNKEKKVTKAEILNNKHAVVRFTATWCPPCKALAPIFDEVAAAHPDVVTYVVDVDQNQDLARDMGIRGLPTMLQIKDNALSLSMVGAQPKEEVEKLFK